MIKHLIFRERSTELASPKEIQEFEAEFGMRLPLAFVDFCSKHNGGAPALSNRFYRVPETYRAFHEEYGQSSKGPVGIIVDVLFGLTRSLDTCDLRPELRSIREGSSIRLIPITLDLFGNSAVLLEAESSGQVYWRDHELWESPDVPLLLPIAENLELFYNALEADPYIQEGSSAHRETFSWMSSRGIAVTFHMVTSNNSIVENQAMPGIFEFEMEMSRKEVIEAAEQKLLRPLTAVEKSGILQINSLLRLKHYYQVFNSPSYPAAEVEQELANCIKAHSLQKV